MSQDFYNFKKLEVFLFASEKAAWHMVSIPQDISEELNIRYIDYKREWGSLKVECSIGGTDWKTSLFYDSKSKSFVLPLKKSVRDAENIDQQSKVNLKFSVLK